MGREAITLSSLPSPAAPPSRSDTRYTFLPQASKATQTVWVSTSCGSLRKNRVGHTQFHASGAVLRTASVLPTFAIPSENVLPSSYSTHRREVRGRRCKWGWIRSLKTERQKRFFVRSNAISKIARKMQNPCNRYVYHAHNLSPPPDPPYHPRHGCEKLEPREPSSKAKQARQGRHKYWKYATAS